MKLRQKVLVLFFLVSGTCLYGSKDPLNRLKKQTDILPRTNSLSEINDFFNSLFDNPVDLVRGQINRYIQNKKPDYLNNIDICFNGLNSHPKNFALARQTYGILVECVRDLVQNKSKEEIKELLPFGEGIFKMTLRFCYVERYKKNIDDLDCKKFIKKIDNYVNCDDPQETIFFTSQQYFKYVLPIISSFNGGVPIEKLNLAGKGLRILPPEIYQIITLKYLDLSNNELVKIPDGIQSLISLETLNFSGNKLIAVPQGMFQLTELGVLDLSNNQITDLPEDMNMLVHLEHLNLAQNKLTIVPDGLAKLPLLRRLFLQSNQLTALPEQFATLNYIMIDISGNVISTESGPIKALKGKFTVTIIDNIIDDE